AGPGGLSAHTIADYLWPDLEADAACHNVDTNVHRLRKLLGVGDVLVSAQGRIALGATRCWVDAWAFERLAGDCGQASQDRKIEKGLEALGLYKGHVLNREGEQPWALAFHEKLATRMIQLAETVGKAMEQRGDMDSAIELYHRTLALDNVSEPIYRRLIACLKERGEVDEALKVYRRCRELLSDVLGIQPSQETQALADTLRH